MVRRHRLLILIPAILLLPILLGMVPLNIAHRLASGGPFTHCKQAQLKNNCLFHSAVSHDDPTIVNLDLTPLDLELTPTLDIQALDPESVPCNVTFNSVPLRC
jgi:hypothetical protein